MGKTFGVDLGTTNSAMSILENGAPVMVANAEGAYTTPSVVAFTNKGETIVGNVAVNQAVTNADRTFIATKRHMGTDWRTPDIDGKKYSPEEIGARILMKLKKDAEEFTGEEIDTVVITVPAYFNDAERQATKNAGEIAGLKVERVLDEPTAAALAYGIEKEDQVVLVYDLGGGTFDVSLLEIGDGFIEVLATAGDNRLGGVDWDEAIEEWVISEFKKEHNVDVSNDFTAKARIREVAEKAKKELSSAESATISLPYLALNPENNTPLSFQRDLTRAAFEAMTEDLLNRTREPVERVLSDANISKEQVNQVLLVGGSTRMPAVSSLVKELTGKEPNKTVNPDEVVAMGASLQGGIKTGEVKEMVVIDVTSLTVGLKARDGNMVPLIKRGTAKPCRASQIFTTAADGQTSVQVEVYQGERPMVSGNKKLGQFDLTGIPPAPAGTPQIEVTFDIDVNGILTVTAQDKASGVTQNVTVTGASGMDDLEVQAAIRDAEANAEADARARELVATKNRAESLLLQNKKLLSEYKDKAGSEAGMKLDEDLKKLEGAVASEDIEAMKTASDVVFESSQQFGATLYSQQ